MLPWSFQRGRLSSSSQSKSIADAFPSCRHVNTNLNVPEQQTVKTSALIHYLSVIQVHLISSSGLLLLLIPLGTVRVCLVVSVFWLRVCYMWYMSHGYLILPSFKNWEGPDDKIGPKRGQQSGNSFAGDSFRNLLKRKLFFQHFFSDLHHSD